jgi:hypothetical protein
MPPETVYGQREAFEAELLRLASSDQNYEPQSQFRGVLFHRYRCFIEARRVTGSFWHLLQQLLSFEAVRKQLEEICLPTEARSELSLVAAADLLIQAAYGQYCLHTQSQQQTTEDRE